MEYMVSPSIDKAILDPRIIHKPPKPTTIMAKATGIPMAMRTNSAQVISNPVSAHITLATCPVES
jgi:hypothetical protein